MLAGCVVVCRLFISRPKATGRVTKIEASLTQHDKPLGVLGTIAILLGVSEGRDVDLVGLVDLILGSVSDEDRLSSPLDDDLYLYQW